MCAKKFSKSVSIVLRRGGLIFSAGHVRERDVQGFKMDGFHVTVVTFDEAERIRITLENGMAANIGDTVPVSYTYDAGRDESEIAKFKRTRYYQDEARRNSGKKINLYRFRTED